MARWILGLCLVVSTAFAHEELLVSQVDVNCIQSYADNDGWDGVLPETAIRYANRCREEVSVEACSWIKKSPNGACVLKLQQIDKFGTVLPATLESYRQACVTIAYRCK